MVTLPIVSVVIPTYGHRDFVLAAIHSAMEQAGVTVEIIVVNDGSPDDTAAVLKPLVDAGQIRYFEQPNAGQAAARNRGIAAAKGDFIALLDDDDLMPPGRLLWQTQSLQRNPDALMVFGYCTKFGDAVEENIPNDPPRRLSFEDCARWCPLASPGQALFRPSALQRNPLDDTLRGTDDWDLYLRLARQGDILYENRHALKYRAHAANASRNFWRMYTNGKRVVDKNLPAGSSSRELRNAALSFNRQYSSQMGVNEIILFRRQRRFGRMVRALMKTIWINPALLSPADLYRRAQYILGRR
jgi:glycosyltransferase involved in cell wall biosynthesis